MLDKFHVMRHLGEALSKVCRSEYHRLSGTDRAFVKGQLYNLLSRWENLSQTGRQALGRPVPMPPDFLARVRDYSGDKDPAPHLRWKRLPA